MTIPKGCLPKMGPLKGAALEVCHKDGRPWSMEDQRSYVLKRLDDTDLIWCDMTGFLFDETGRPTFIDDCGNSHPAPEDDPDLVVNLIGPFSYESEVDAEMAFLDIVDDLLMEGDLSRIVDGNDELIRLFRLALAHLQDPDGNPWPKDARYPEGRRERFLEAVYDEGGWHRRVGLATNGPLYVRNLQAEAIARLLEEPCTPRNAAELHVLCSWAAFAKPDAYMHTSIARGEGTPWCLDYDWNHAATDRWVHTEGQS